jgi:hypothetical protein
VELALEVEAPMFLPDSIVAAMVVVVESILEAGAVVANRRSTHFLRKILSRSPLNPKRD